MYRSNSFRNTLARQALIAASLIGTAAVGCGDDTSTPTGGSGGGDTGGTSPGGNNPGGMNEGGGGAPPAVIECIDVEANATCTSADAQECVCTGCELDECGDGETFNDCVCLSCAADAFCLADANCTGDGVCDPYNEGCLCSDCAEHPSCVGWVEDCGNGADDNGNGTVDCADAQCAALPACQEDCANGVDDNGNGDIDCDDAQCFEEKSCAEDCVNATDDNDNGLIDCLDVAYCQNAPTCVAPACLTPTVAIIGANAGDTTSGTALINTACGADPGTNEKVFSFTPATTGYLSITLASPSDDQGFAVRTDCADIATEIACVDDVAAGTDELGFVEVVAATPLTIIVNAFTTTDSGPFTLTLAAAAAGACLDDGICSAAVGEGCSCTDCAEAPVCGFCDDTPASCDTTDACTCSACDADAFCIDAGNCLNDGFCDQFNEGCVCADCAAVPNCL